MIKTNLTHRNKIARFILATYLLSASFLQAAATTDAPVTKTDVRDMISTAMAAAMPALDVMVTSKVNAVLGRGSADAEFASSDSSSVGSELEGLNTPLKRSIAKYIPQVFKIEFAGEHGEHMGTGFMFNAAEGIIATNHHVVTSNMGRFKVILENDDEYSGKDIEIMGTSPSQQLGDFAFLRINKLKGKFEQMPFSEDHHVKKRGAVAFMGNSLGSFSIEDGIINGRYSYDMGAQIHAIQVHLHSKGGASGSPTFDSNAKINGILFAGDDEHTLILPIWFVQKAYAQMMCGEGIHSTSLGTTFTPESIFELEKFYDTPRGLLIPYLPTEDAESEKSLLVVDSNYKGTEGEALKAGDVILNINGVAVGCDSIRLTELLESRALSEVKVLRLGDEVTLNVKPKITTQTFMKRIVLQHGAICSVGSALHMDSGFPLETAVYMSAHSDVDEEDGSSVAGLVGAIGKIPTPTFNDFVRALHHVFVLGEKHHLLFRIDTYNPADPHSVMKVDLSLLEGTELYVEQFDLTLHRWKKIALTAYVASIA